MDFLFDPQSFLGTMPNASNPFSAMFLLIQNGGWILILLTLIWGAWIAWVEYIRNKFNSEQEEILLAIDIPKGNEQSPKAVEHIFSHLFGIYKGGTLKDKYIKGYNQWAIGLEIVSIEGYIQFLIHTPLRFRDLVEASIYAQYPDAEITEVEDYVNLIPKPLEFPHREWDFWGSEFAMQKNELYPIVTWPTFEHSLSQTFMDPMASMLESMSRMGPGEHLWLQIIIAPENSSWKKRSEALINRLIGKKNGGSKSDWMYFPREITKGLSESMTASIIPPSEMAGANQKTEREWPSMMQHLSPSEKEVVEAIGLKMNKLGFKSKIRFIYAAKKEVLNKPKGVDAIKGALLQFSSQNLNGFILDTKTRTKINYFFKKTRTLWRKHRILRNYRARSIKKGRRKYILNIEELATIWHFPISEVVQVPTVQTVAAKKGQAPTNIPVDRGKETVLGSSMFTNKDKEPERKISPPPNIPFV
ncbi:MAG: hypothetical protein ACNFW9_02195 [Candidatus Kerfeldbacteria bacterium]